MDALERLQQLEDESLERINQSTDLQTLEQIRVQYLGRDGSVTGILRMIGQLPADQRAAVGLEANQVKQSVERSLSEATSRLQEQALERTLEADAIDITLPGRPASLGTFHPLQQTFEEVLSIFVSMGYAIARGPEVEAEWYNFTGLNIPEDHPARDMQDSYYVAEDWVLRSQTSPIQLRYMQSVAPRLPVRVVGPGRTYRRDTEDMSHSPVFHQCEALLIDEGVTFAQLRGTLQEFARRLFGDLVQVRFRPSYFPFTEPSAEVDVSCTACNGAGCSTCGGSGYLEILGAGMVHPQVLRNGGYDPEKVAGFAFGVGIERLAMLRYGINDLRHFYRNDLRFLSQF